MDELRAAPGQIELPPEEFRRLGHDLVDEIADFLETLPQRPVATGESPREVRAALGERSLPDHGEPPSQLLHDAAELLFEHSLLSGHPRFFGYIIGAPSPIGALADLLAASVNPNVGGFTIAPMATEIESQTVRWISELVGYRPGCGGLLVSGGNMANFVGFWAALRDRCGASIRTQGVGGLRPRVYTSTFTHTWIENAADLSGLGTGAIRWIPADERQRMDTSALRERIRADREVGDQPFLVVGAGGTVATGSVDPLAELAEICREENLWFHVDGAYGAFAAGLPDAPEDLKSLSLADSVALDPHKWLYIPVEAGCALTRDRDVLYGAFSYRPPYYHFDHEEEEPLNYYELGPQNSRGFKALKVWLALRQVGRDGYLNMIGEDCELARELYRVADANPLLEARTQGLSITTFRYVPEEAAGDDEYLNELNSALLTQLERGGEAFVSKAVLDDRVYLRACIVNFRTTADDVRALPEIVCRVGAEVHAGLRATA